MSQPKSSATGEQSSGLIPASSSVPLSERPLIVREQHTVISGKSEPAVTAPDRNENLTLRQRLFPGDGSEPGSEAGVRLAHFEIRERIGAGGMGAVFRGIDTELSREVAIKVLHPGSTRDTSMIARFRNESRACAQLSHDNIARVYYAGSQDGLFFIAYEFARGKTLRDLILERDRLTPAEAVNYAIQITLALNHLSASGVVHRDIKPSNLMLTEGGRIKVVDFGLARRETDDSIGHITVAGTTLGTFDYIAPEQARDPRLADIRSDIYSLGCTMYHMLSGNPPYPEGTALQKLLDHQGKSPPRLSSVNPEVPEELSAITGRMMSNDPDRRYQSPGILLNDLIQMASLLGLQGVPAEGLVWKSAAQKTDEKPTGYFWMFASVSVICLTAVLSFSGLFQPGRPVSQTDPGPAMVNANDFAASTAGTETNSTGATETSAVAADGPLSSSAAVNTTIVSVTGPEMTIAESNGEENSPEPRDAPVTPLPPVPGETEPSRVVLAEPPSEGMPTAEAVEKGPFLLQGSDGNAVSFRTLKAAVADAKSGDVILLRYNGFPDDLPAQPPVRLVGTNLIVRAADGYRPTLQFDAQEDESTGQGRTLSLRGDGSLTLRKLRLRLEIREDQRADRWSMIQLFGPNRVELEDVSIEVINPGEQPVALFDLVDDAQTLDETPRGDTEVVLNRVMARIQGDVFRVACQPRGQIQLLNSGLAVDGRLLELRGDASMPQSQGNLTLKTDHLTCIHSGPLIQTMDGSPGELAVSARLLPRLTVESEASVYGGTAEETPLIRSDGSLWIEDIEQQLSWTGFTNIYQGYSVFWSMQSSALEPSSRTLDFDGLQELWQSRSDSQDTGAELAESRIWRSSVWQDESEFDVLNFQPASFGLNAFLFIPGGGGFARARDGMVPGVNPEDLVFFQFSDRNPEATQPSPEVD